MAIELKKVADLVYSELLTLRVIEDDEDLRNIFSETSGLTFNVLYQLSKVDKLKVKDKEVLLSLFDNIICMKKNLVDKYNKFDGKEVIEEEEVAEYVAPEEPIVVKPLEVLPPKTAVSVADKKPKAKESDVPRRYGKEAILKDIKKQGGKATPTQNAMLKVNDLKNIYVNLQSRGIKDMLTGTHLLSDADCRDIVSVVTIAQRKLEEILKRKNKS